MHEKLAILSHDKAVAKKEKSCHSHFNSASETSQIRSARIDLIPDILAPSLETCVFGLQ